VAAAHRQHPDPAVRGEGFIPGFCRAVTESATLQPRIRRSNILCRRVTPSMRLANFLFHLLFSLAACYCVAQTPDSKPLSPIPPNGFQFTGTWDCEGAFRNATVHKSTFTGTSILGGKWLELTEQDLQPATGYLAKYLIGYDSQQKRLVEFDANNFGAAVYVSNQGWQNNVLTMTSPILQDAEQPYVANRFLYSITGPDAFTVDWQISKTAALNWVQADHLACKRRSNG
jgi:hypothetical protein